jgi:hypothetical protein
MIFHLTSDWTFFTGSDPTGGNVNYQDQSDAESEGLAYVDYSDDTTVLAVDSTSTVAAGGNRNACVMTVLTIIYALTHNHSVRITSPNSYNGGLFVMDAVKMPVGCSTWPSFWTVGPNWPYGGEIDIVEGINDQTRNQMTLHSGTSNACTIDTDDSYQYTGSVISTNCYSTEDSDSGCTVMDSSTTFVSLILCVNLNLMVPGAGLLRMASTMQGVASLRFYGTVLLACQCGTLLALTSLRILRPEHPRPPIGALRLVSGLQTPVTYQTTSTTTRWSLTLLSAATGQVVVPMPVLDAQGRARIWSPMLLTTLVSFHRMLNHSALLSVPL